MHSAAEKVTGGSPVAERFRWRVFVELFTRPQPVTVPMVILLLIVPLYIFIGQEVAPGRAVYVPQIAWDRALPLRPAWSVVYGSLFLAALLPVFVVHQQELVRRTVFAFLMAWLAAYAVFIAFPTVSSRPAKVVEEGFFTWLLAIIYASDVRYNCFPSLHVAQCFLAALVCHRVHRGVGWAAGVWAALVAMSTLFTKQHYVLDVVGGVLLAFVANFAFVRSYPRESIPEQERRYAPVLAAAAAAIYAVVVVGFRIGYSIGTA